MTVSDVVWIATGEVLLAVVIRLCVIKSHQSASRAEKLEAERDHLLEYVAALTGAKK
jgi:hypothetical protein